MAQAQVEAEEEAEELVQLEDKVMVLEALAALEVLVQYTL
jgi:hypothetical protein